MGNSNSSNAEPVLRAVGLNILTRGIKESEFTLDVVFVHGLRGHPVNTWSTDGTFWPRDLLSEDLETARIISWGYDANIENLLSPASQESLFGNSVSLLNRLAPARRNAVRPRCLFLFNFQASGDILD